MVCTNDWRLLNKEIEMTNKTLVRLQGEVYYLPRIALPGNCKLTVELSDISGADDFSEVIDVCEKPINHQVPIPFELRYATDRYPVPGHTYGLSAQIEHENRLIWISDTVHEVTLTGEDQTGLMIKVIQVNG
ncbi:putative lipoprotein [Pseudomonas cannabina]|uniref:Lipoprotein-related protein, YcsW superfamily n=2 Tax=Pseudomonas cannabina TaxID=86840 RepID=A0A0P9L4V3_PSECA|nr:Lipoprotein-related protein, YcsW superfamily [Pseudomonas cannabina]RMN31367.1 putative lipoprotein [Pseudomonas cannabina]